MDKEEMIFLLKDIMETAQQCGRPNTPDVGEWYTVFSTAQIIRDELKNEGMFNTINVENCIFTFAQQIFKRLSEEEKKKILNSSVLPHKTLLFSDFEEYVRTTLCSNFEYDFGFSLLDLEEEKIERMIKMMNAKEMFESIGYYLIEETKERVVYKNVDDYIVFDNRHELVHRYRLANLPGDYKTKLPMALTYNELRAINQQVKELKWYD